MAREMYPEKFVTESLPTVRPSFYETRQPAAGVFKVEYPMFTHEDLSQHPDPFGEGAEAQKAAMPSTFMGYPVKVVDRLTDDPNPLGRMATPEEAEEMARSVVESASTSPLSRLFTAVRVLLGKEEPHDDVPPMSALRDAYDSLNLDD